MSVDVLVCCGVGGAGKTTTAAALGVGHALAGRRVVVLTIDPARRLADALGIEQLGNEPRAISLPAAEANGGRLDALMLDRKATWDEVVRQHAPSVEVAERLMANPYYLALSTRLTGGHEYMATEKLYQLATSGIWDLVVVDTPPSHHAVDFFRAPDRIRRLLDRRLLGALLTPSSGLLGAATRRVVDVVRSLAGPKVMDDLEDFFRTVGALSSGFRERGAAVHALLHAPTTHFLLVANATSPRTDDVEELVGIMREEDLRVGGFVLNRVTAALAVPEGALLSAIPASDKPGWDEVRASLVEAVRQRVRRAAEDAALTSQLAATTGASVWTVPDVRGGVSDLSGLEALSWNLPPASEPVVTAD